MADILYTIDHVVFVIQLVSSRQRKGQKYDVYPKASDHLNVEG